MQNRLFLFLRTFIPYFFGVSGVIAFGVIGYIGMATSTSELVALALISWLIATISVCFIPSKGE